MSKTSGGVTGVKGDHPLHVPSFYSTQLYSGTSRPGLPACPLPPGRDFDTPRPKILPTPIQKVSKKITKEFWPKIGKAVPAPAPGFDLPLKRSLILCPKFDVEIKWFRNDWELVGSHTSIVARLPHPRVRRVIQAAVTPGGG